MLSSQIRRISATAVDQPVQLGSTSNIRPNSIYDMDAYLGMRATI